MNEVQAYIDQFEGETKSRLEAVRAVLLDSIPGAQEKISYGIPTMYLHGNIVHYAGYARHIGFYATPSGSDEFKQELASYKQGKGSVQFPHTEPLPLDLIRRMAEFRSREVHNQAISKGKIKG